MSRLLGKLREMRGQVALEVVVVLAIWLVIIIMFVNVMFTMSSMMIIQSTVNRLAVQVGALGCYPAEQFQNDLQSTAKGVFGAQANGSGNFSVEHFYWPVEAESSTTRPLNRFPSSVLRDIPVCQPRVDGAISANEKYVPSDSYVTISLSYRQRVWVFLEQDVTRSATSISSRLETAQ